ncbi:hypothetical protein EV421DRAFT_591380 [Armillaria borealis]|uniref:Uncharacterized protein n=1 Tax=Armillaria borealis TaxID=47425 RepID=A0AA39ICK4_9AGAR|nr:hypothetical protein EV421DRAFT_591380 [Armillaria borealis]
MTPSYDPYRKTRLYSGVILHINVYVACNTSDMPTILYTVRSLVATLKSKGGDAKHYHGGQAPVAITAVTSIPLFHCLQRIWFGLDCRFYRML